VPAIPLYQTPTIVATKSFVHGVVVNPTDEGWAWDAGDWWLER